MVPPSVMIPLLVTVTPEAIATGAEEMVTFAEERNVRSKLKFRLAAFEMVPVPSMVKKGSFHLMYHY
jgi:hypothetical protein